MQKNCCFCKWIILLFGLFSIYSCDRNEDKVFPFKKYIIEDSLFLPFNTDTIINIRNYDNSDGHLLYLISNNHRLYFFNNQNHQLTDITPNFISIEDAFIKNLDSIFILYKNRILIADTARKVKSIIDLNVEQIYFSANKLFPMYVIDTLIFLFQYPNFVINNLKAYQKYISTSREFCYDFKNNRIIKNDNLGKYPNEVKNNFQYIFNPYRIIDDKGNIIYSFETSDTIWLYNLYTKNYSKKYVHSHYFKTNSTFNFNQINNYEYISQYLIENSRYYVLYYDSYRHLYYRIILHSYLYKDKDKINLRTDVPWSILVCDTNFKVLHEVSFDKQTYYFTHLIITEQGVLLKKYNYENEYTLFNFSN